MSLEGSLETIALPDVLSLLAATAKSGELLVDSGERGGRLTFDAGCLVGFAVPRSRSALDAVFELLRLERGRFVFDPEGSVSSGTGLVDGCPAAVVPLLDEAADRLARWPAIEAVIPAFDWWVSLQIPPGRRAVSLAPGQWDMVVAIGDGGVVGEVLWGLRRGDFDGCVALKALVDDGLAVVRAPMADGHPGALGLAERAVAAEEAAPAEPDADGGDRPGDDDHEGGGVAAPVGASDDVAAPSQADDEAVSAPAEPGGPAEQFDGLADRGPWTTGELASLVRMGGWVDAPAEPAGLTDSVAPVGSGPGEEFSGPMAMPEHAGRGVFGKLLSSVRS